MLDVGRWMDGGIDICLICDGWSNRSMLDI